MFGFHFFGEKMNRDSSKICENWGIRELPNKR